MAISGDKQQAIQLTITNASGANLAEWQITADAKLQILSTRFWENGDFMPLEKVEFEECIENGTSNSVNGERLWFDLESI